MLAFAALMLTGGTLGDILGRKKVMLAGVAIFCAGSVVAALAASAGVLIAGRIVMGVGAAASEPGTLSLIRQIYPDARERGRARSGSGPRSRASRCRSGRCSAACSSAGRAGAGSSGSASSLGRGRFAAAAVTLTESADPGGAEARRPRARDGAGAILAATFAVIEGENRGYGTWWIGAPLRARGGRCSSRSSSSSGASRIPCSSSSSSATRPSRPRTSSPSRRSSRSSRVFFFTALYLQLIANFAASTSRSCSSRSRSR